MDYFTGLTAGGREGCCFQRKTLGLLHLSILAPASYYIIYIHFGLLSAVCTELRTRELGKVCRNVYFPYKNAGLGRYLDRKDI